MTINAINGTLLSALSAINGRTLSTLNGINGQTVASTFSRTLTIDHTKCGATDSTNFPVLVSFTNATFKTVANGGHVQNANGYDIIFWSDSGHTSKLDFEIEFYSATTGQIVFWVRLPTVSHTVDTVFYMTYGDPAISTFQGNVAGTWNSNYVSVFHLPNGSSLTTTDSTTNGLNLTVHNSVSAAAGQIDGCASFAVGAYLDHVSDTAYNSSDWTLEAWVFNTGSITQNSIASRAPTTASAGQWYVFINGSNSDKLRIDIPFVLGNACSGATQLTQNAWHHVGATKVGNVYTVYLAGNSDGTGTHANAPTQAGPLQVGAFQNTDTFRGRLDEVRISNAGRGADWMLTSFNNQDAPTSFITLGTEV